MNKPTEVQVEEPLPPMPQPIIAEGVIPCEDCDGVGIVGQTPGTYFDPPEHIQCDSCGGSGKWKGIPLFTDCQLREYVLADRRQRAAPQEAEEQQAVWLIHFDDQDRRPEIVIGEAGARARFARISDNWNAHLFVKVASNSRDDRFANANIRLASPAAAPSALRMLTKDEIYEAIIPADGDFRRSMFAAYEAAVRKFCEVNGLAIGPAPSAKKDN